jgi:ectoine hydroxylase-related dioxygenase (phytanoyl-CoA dioxygenase family)
MAFERAVPRDALIALKRDVAASVADCGRMQVAAGIGAEPDGTAHHAVGRYESFDRFLAEFWLDEYVSRYFGGAPYILHAFNPATVAPERSSYLHNIHRDVRTHAGAFRLLLNMLVMVDDFKLENGATFVLSGSHHEPAKPDETRFFQRAERLVFPAGTIVLFDSNLWHAAGQNRSSHTRAALTLSFSRAFVKQQMDYPRFLGAAYGAKLSPRLRQLLGYNAMTPASYEEWYRPRDARLYRADQG